MESVLDIGYRAGAQMWEYMDSLTVTTGQMIDGIYHTGEENHQNLKAPFIDKKK